MSQDSEIQRKSDEEQLRLLAIFHYILAGIGALLACIPLLHVGFGIMLMTHPEGLGDSKSPPPPAWFGLLFALMGGLFVLLGWATAICTFMSGRYLASRRKRMFSFVVAAILCAFMPFGTVLGVFTIIALSKDSVKRLYGHPV